MNMVDLYWGGSLFSNLYSFFHLGCQIALRRETKQVGLSRSLSIRNTTERLIERIKLVLPLQLFDHLIQKNRFQCCLSLFPLILTINLPESYPEIQNLQVLRHRNINHKEKWVLYKPALMWFQVEINVTFSLLYRTDFACHSLISIQKNQSNFHFKIH